MIKIRIATEADWPYLDNINQVIDYGNPKEFMIESVKHKRVLVAETNEQILGYALWQNLWGNNPFLALLKVLPQHQKNGIGLQLLGATETAIKKTGFKSYLSSTELKNSVGQKWHEKNNFVPIGQLSMMHGKEIFYKKDL